MNRKIRRRIVAAAVVAGALVVVFGAPSRPTPQVVHDQGPVVKKPPEAR